MALIEFLQDVENERKGQRFIVSQVESPIEARGFCLWDFGAKECLSY